MINPTSLQAELIATLEKYIQQVLLFTPDTFVKKPNDQGWSAAEVAEHILIINENLSKVLQAEGIGPDRAPDKKIRAFKEVLANRSIKIEAPEKVKPTGKLQDQQVVITDLQKQLQALNKIIEEKELEVLCEVYPHPRLGRLTRLEWINFIIYHTERHGQQLEEIYNQLVNAVNTEK